MALDTQINRLHDLTKAVTDAAQQRAAGLEGKRGRGRYGRRPNFGVMSAPSTRPDSGSGVTFHFKHSFVSKTNSVSQGYRDLTSAPAHQRYIERAGAAERIDGETGEEREISFGNLGATKEERADFWRKVEQIESKSGRVQCRMIIELPHELSPAGRESAARAFMAKFAERGLPHWAVIHAPDEHNDRRNYHLHAVYYDRPCERLADGKWDFEVVTEARWANGQKVAKRPLKQNKDAEARGKEWIRQLRFGWSEVANEALVKEGISKRYDPRPYRESGVRKMPTAHLGNKIALAESQGIDTKIGAENARREMRFRLGRPDTAFERISLAIDHAMISIQVAAANPKTGGNPAAALRAAIGARQALSAGIKAAKAREANALAVDVIGARLDRRAGFLDAEYDRLIVAPPRWLGEDDALRVASGLWDERLLIEDAQDDLAPFSAGCRQAALDHDRDAARLDAERRGAATAMLRAFPALRQILPSEELADLGLALAAQDAGSGNAGGKSGGKTTSIDAPANPAEPTTAPVITDPVAEPKTKPKGGSGNKSGGGSAVAKPTKATQSDDATPAKDARDRTSDVIAIDAEKSTELPDGEKAPDRALEIPGALILVKPEDAKKLSEQLSALPGWQLRYHALATRDAIDFADKDEQAKQHEAAMVHVRREAADRGLDLETGRMYPDQAKDKKAFERWRAEHQQMEAELAQERQR